MGALDWIGNNSSWLLPVGNAVLGAFGASQQSSNQNRMLDATQQAITDEYNREQSQNAVDAQNADAQGAYAASAHAANAGAAAKNRQSALAAAAATRANQMAARQAGDQVNIQQLRTILQTLAPFRKTALQLLPAMQKSYNQGNDALQKFGGQLLVPGTFQQAFTPQLAVNQRIPLGKQLVGGAQ